VFIVAIPFESLQRRRCQSCPAVAKNSPVSQTLARKLLGWWIGSLTL
jgi:hypothetical protein